METAVTVRLSSGIRLLLLLIAGGEIMAAVTSSRKYAIVNTSVTLNMMSCSTEDIDTITWKKLNKELELVAKARKQVDVLPVTYPDYILYGNGSLTVHRVLAGKTAYNAEAYNKNGKPVCDPVEISVTGQYKVDKPSLEVTCRGKKYAMVICSVSQGTEPRLSLKVDNSEGLSVNDIVLNQTISLRSQPSSITCFANNQVSSQNSTKEASCDNDKGSLQLSWYVILAAAAGGIAFIIFLILIIYSVRSCRRSGRAEEEPAYYHNQAHNSTQQRQLPTLPGHPAPPSVSLASEEHPSAKKPPPHHSQGAPESKKRRPAPPQLPTDALPPGPAKLPLPGNHPSERLPQPQPRTKSKPPRKQRRTT